jgi:NAD+ kinase
MPKTLRIQRLAVLAKTHARAKRPLRALLGAAARLNVSLAVDEDVARWAGLKNVPVFPSGSLPRNCPVVVVLGGDGTLLRAARLSSGRHALLGVNTGKMGFLTGVPASRIAEAMKRLKAGDFFVEARGMFEVTLLRRGRKVQTLYALNDAVVHQGDIARILSLELYHGREHLTTLRADGVIAATPTGSTAYSLAAGGAVVHPAMNAMLVTPIAPHSLSFRPLVLPDTAPLRVVLRERMREARLTVDGQTGIPLRRGDSVLVRRAGFQTRLIRFPGSSFFGVLRGKLRWGAR